jgi:hypothetical protein
MFVTCNTLWTTLLNKWGMTTQAQKDAFCAIVSSCVASGGSEVVSGLAPPVNAPTNGEKVVVVQGTGGAPNQAYFWTGTQWILMGDGVGSGFSGLTFGAGGNVSFTGNGTAGSPLVGSVTIPAPPPAPASACDQNKAAPAGVIAEVFGQNAAGACVREAVVVAPTLCQEIAALPAGAIATVVGRDSSGNCITGTVSAGGSAPAATDTVAGISALNLGSDLPADATNATDALTASGLIGILGQVGGNQMVAALCTALTNANCFPPYQPAAPSNPQLQLLCEQPNGTGPINSPGTGILYYDIVTAAAGIPVNIEKLSGGSWVSVASGNTAAVAGAPAGTLSSLSGALASEAPAQGEVRWYRVTTNGLVGAPQKLIGYTCPPI